MCLIFPLQTSVKSDLERPDITASMTIMGNTINRLANNSNVCKTVTVTLTGLIIGLKTEITLTSLCCVLICIFALFYQDCLYCTLKKGVINISEGLRKAAETKDYSKYQPFVIPKIDTSLKAILNNWTSRSILPFYGAITIALIITFIHEEGICNICALLQG